MKSTIRLLSLIIALTIVVGSLFLFRLSPVQAQTPTPGNSVFIYLFWGDGCPHCAKAKPFFEGLAAKYPEVVLLEFEVYNDPENYRLFSLMAEMYGGGQMAVPTIFVGPYYQLGYSEQLDVVIEDSVVQCIKDGCVDLGAGVIKPPVPPESTATSFPSETPLPTRAISETHLLATPAILPTVPTSKPEEKVIGTTSRLDKTNQIDIPILGNVNLDSQSTIVSTVLIALVDGFNPCSLWVLCMLLALTLHTGSRKKVFIIGVIFLTVTAGIYALFIAGLFSIIKLTSFMGWIRILIAVIALVFAVVNIKDYFWYKAGISLTIADENKPDIYKRMRSVVNAGNSFWAMVGATIALAAGVSLVEFSCTAGFPVIWTNILAAQNISGMAFVLLLVLYMLIYQFDEMIIFMSSVVTLKASRIEEKHGRILKLISGMLMLTLSIVMLINPALLNSLSSSLIIFGIAFVVTIAVLLIHRYALPLLGISISEDVPRK